MLGFDRPVAARLQQTSRRRFGRHCVATLVTRQNDTTTLLGDPSPSPAASLFLMLVVWGPEKGMISVTIRVSGRFELWRSDLRPRLLHLRQPFANCVTKFFELTCTNCFRLARIKVQPVQGHFIIINLRYLTQTAPWSAC